MNLHRALRLNSPAQLVVDWWNACSREQDSYPDTYHVGTDDYIWLHPGLDFEPVRVMHSIHLTATSIDPARRWLAAGRPAAAIVFDTDNENGWNEEPEDGYDGRF